MTPSISVPFHYSQKSYSWYSESELLRVLNRIKCLQKSNFNKWSREWVTEHCNVWLLNGGETCFLWSSSSGLWHHYILNMHIAAFSTNCCIFTKLYHVTLRTTMIFIATIMRIPNPMLYVLSPLVYNFDRWCKIDCGLPMRNIVVFSSLYCRLENAFAVSPVIIS